MSIDIDDSRAGSVPSRHGLVASDIQEHLPVGLSRIPLQDDRKSPLLSLWVPLDIRDDDVVEGLEQLDPAGFQTVG